VAVFPLYSFIDVYMPVWSLFWGEESGRENLSLVALCEYPTQNSQLEHQGLWQCLL